MKQIKKQVVKYQGKYYDFETLKNGQIKLKTNSKSLSRPLNLDLVQIYDVIIFLSSFFGDFFKPSLPPVLYLTNNGVTNRYGLWSYYTSPDVVTVGYKGLDDDGLLFSASTKKENKARREVKKLLKDNGFLN